jgi:DNA polymerase-4
MDRSVLHVDVPAFPIAVGRVVDPALRGRPVLIAPPGSGRAVVLCVSEEAAGEGVRRGMPVQAALRRCPGATVLAPDEALHRRAAAALLRLLAGYSPLVEPAAHGQAFLDLTGTGRLFGAAQDTAARIRREIDARLRLRATAGVAINKLVSRVAARVVRPDGLYDVFPGSEAAFLAPLPVGLLPAAHGEAAARLFDLNVGRVEELLRFSTEQMRFAFGAGGERLRCQALGIDAAPVRPPESAAAIVEEETLAEDSNDEAALLAALWRLCERAGARLRRLPAQARRLRLSLRYADTVTARRDERLPAPAAADLLLFRAAREALGKARVRRVRVRWFEIACLDLVRGPRQLGLFGPEAFAGGAPAAGGGGEAAPGDGRPWRDALRFARDGAAEALAEAADRIRRRFGARAIVAGRLLPGGGPSGAAGVPAGPPARTFSTPPGRPPGATPAGTKAASARMFSTGPERAASSSSARRGGEAT